MLARITTLKIVETGLMVLAVGLMCYAGYAYWSREMPQLSGLDENVGSPTVEDFTVNTVLNEISPFAEYRARMEKRSLFGDQESETAVEAPAPQAAAVTQDKSFAQEYKIVGIVLGDPSEVIIEFTKFQQTVFLQEGDTQGDISIETISGDKVLLKYKGVLIESPLTE